MPAVDDEPRIYHIISWSLAASYIFADNIIFYSVKWLYFMMHLFCLGL